MATARASSPIQACLTLCAL